MLKIWRFLHKIIDVFRSFFLKSSKIESSNNVELRQRKTVTFSLPDYEQTAMDEVDNFDNKPPIRKNKRTIKLRESCSKDNPCIVCRKK